MKEGEGEYVTGGGKARRKEIQKPKREYRDKRNKKKKEKRIRVSALEREGGVREGERGGSDRNTYCGR